MLGKISLPKSGYPNGQVERMNRTIKDATTKAFHYTLREELRSHLKDYL